MAPRSLGGQFVSVGTSTTVLTGIDSLASDEFEVVFVGDATDAHFESIATVSDTGRESGPMTGDTGMISEDSETVTIAMGDRYSTSRG